MRARGWIVCTFASASVVLACTGATETELFSAPTDAVSGTEPSPTGAGVGSDDGTNAASSTSSGGSSSGASGSSTSSSSSSSSTSSSSSGSSGAPDAGPPPWKSAGITCGDETCTASSEFCCARPGDFGTDFQCRATGSGGCQRGALFRCDDRTDCPLNQVCCAAFDNDNGGYRFSTCTPTCTAASVQNFTAVRLCDMNAPVDECQAIGKTCQPSQSVEGYAYCH